MRFTTLDGRTCCSNSTDNPETLCEHCRAAYDAQVTDYRPPESYAAGLRQLRAAAATSTSQFEEQWKAERRRAMAATRAALDEVTS